jgi:hypothetical protein
MANLLIAALRASPSSPALPEMTHFEPLGYPTVVSTISTLGGRAEGVSAATAHRAHLHRRLGVPAERPLFRPAMSLSAQAARFAAGGDRLCNPHTALKPSGVPGGTLYMTEGNYLYHHYMQASFCSSPPPQPSKPCPG